MEFASDFNTDSLCFKIRGSPKIHILTAPTVRAPAGRGSRPCSRKRSDMMRSARTITRFAPPQVFQTPKQFPKGSRSLHNRRLGGEKPPKKSLIKVIGIPTLQRLQSSLKLQVVKPPWCFNTLDSSTEGASPHKINGGKRYESFHKAPTISSAFAFTEPFVTLPK